MRNPFILNRNGVLVNGVRKLTARRYSLIVMTINMLLMACMLYFLVSMQRDINRITILSTGEGEVVIGDQEANVWEYEDTVK